MPTAVWSEPGDEFDRRLSHTYLAVPRSARAGRARVVPRKPKPRSGRLPSAPRTVFRSIPSGDSEYHWSQAGSVDKSIVLGFKSRYLRAEIPNRYVADYCRRSPEKLIGFAGIDPTERTAVMELKLAHEELKLRGVTFSPANQDFHPTDTRAMKVYAQAEELGMPILFIPAGSSPRPASSNMPGHICWMKSPERPAPAAGCRATWPAVGGRDDRDARQAR